MTWTPADWQIVASGAAFMSAIAASAGVIQAARTQRFNLKIQIYDGLERDFYGSKMARHRSRAAKILLEDFERRCATRDLPGDAGIVADRHVAEVCNFLDTVGMWLRRGVLDRRVVFHGFGSRSVAYWKAACPSVFVARERLQRPWMWNDIEDQLFPEVLKYLRKKRGWGVNDPTAEFVRRTLERESQADAGLSEGLD
jgi:hypothetical protein